MLWLLVFIAGCDCRHMADGSSGSAYDAVRQNELATDRSIQSDSWAQLIAGSANSFGAAARSAIIPS